MPRYLVNNMGIKYKGKLYQHGEAITMTVKEAEPLKKYLMLIPEETPVQNNEIRKLPEDPAITDKTSDRPQNIDFMSIKALTELASKENISLEGCKKNDKEAILTRIKAELSKDAETIVPTEEEKEEMDQLLSEDIAPVEGEIKDNDQPGGEL